MSIIEKALEKLDPPLDERVTTRPADSVAVSPVSPVEEGSSANRTTLDASGDQATTIPEVSLAALNSHRETVGEVGRGAAESTASSRDEVQHTENAYVGLQTTIEPDSRKSRLVDINLERLNGIGLLTPTSDNSLLAEQMRVIKRPLVMQAAASAKDRAPNANLIMVASALPNEGKTTTAINLAVSMAMERDHTVLLVDADVAKSDISNTLGITSEVGLTDLFYKTDLQVSDVMLRTNIPSLSVIPAGQRHPNLTELFAGEEMRTLMLEISQRYSDRIIIIDSPPLLATSGASVLGSLVGQIVMVVEAVRTPQRAVAEALRMLGPLDNIGIVLNKARERATYSYGYDYGYEYYVKPGG